MYRLLSSYCLSICLFLFFSLFLFYVKFFFGNLFFIHIFSFNWMNLKFFLLYDSISSFFIILSAFLLLMCIFMSWYLSYYSYMYYFCVSFCMMCLFNLFLTIDIFVLFCFFEAIVMPLFLIVGIWGSSDRKILASYMLFMFTMFGSIFALFVFIFLYLNSGSSNFMFFSDYINYLNLEMMFFLLLFFGFCVKVPIVPFHMWLPEAHVEAPTAGSVLLAGIMLKLGFYVYMSLIVFSMYDVMSMFISFIFMISFMGLYLSSFSALAQVDMKKIMAYSSMSHMNFSLVGLFCTNIISMMGAFFMMFAHAMVSSALFSTIGMLYDRYKTSLLFYYGGLVLLMPLFCSFFFIFMLGNFGMPLTMSFVGEFLIFIGVFFYNNFMIFFSLFGLFLTLVYSLFIYTSISNGLISVFFISFYADYSSREFMYMIVFLFFTMYFGIFPNMLFDYSFSSFYF